MKRATDSLILCVLVEDDTAERRRSEVAVRPVGSDRIAATARSERPRNTGHQGSVLRGAGSSPAWALRCCAALAQASESRSCASPTPTRSATSAADATWSRMAFLASSFLPSRAPRSQGRGDWNCSRAQTPSRSAGSSRYCSPSPASGLRCPADRTRHRCRPGTHVALPVRLGALDRYRRTHSDAEAAADREAELRRRHRDVQPPWGE